MEDLGLGLDNIMDEDSVLAMFGDDEPDKKEEKTEKNEKSSEEELDIDNEEIDITEVADSDGLFGEEPESVGDEEDKHKGPGDTQEQKGGTSPNFFSSIADAFVEEGIFPDLDDDTVKGITDAQGLKDAINQQINAGLTEQQQRIAKALDNGVETDKIKYYENALNILDKLGDKLDDETDEGEDIRRRVIFQDYINRGFSEDRAKQHVDKVFEDGTDKKEAKEALKGNKAFYKAAYQSVLDEAQDRADEEVRKREEQALKLKKVLMEDDIKLFGDMELPKKTRQAAYDAVSKPVYKDPETGEYYTALQKYEHDNNGEFMAKLGLLYTLTDGFKSLDGLVGKKVKKEVKKGFSELEKKLKNSSIGNSGNPSYVDNEGRTFLKKGVMLGF